MVQTFNAGNKEITNNLPHLHQTHYEVVAMQPGNPGSSALGSFTINLHPPGTEGYAAAAPIYSQIDYLNRVELYGSADGASLGKLYYAGIITGIRKGYGQNPIFELSGVSDIGLLNLSKPFPGDTIQTSYGGVTTALSYVQAHTYFGTNEVGFSDSFNPFTAGNYVSTNVGGGATSGTWAGTTDNGLNVVSCSTGTGAALLSKSGATAEDLVHNDYVEITARLSTSSASASNAGKVGVGFSSSNASVSADAIYGYVTAKANGTQYDLDATLNFAGVVTTTTNALTSVKDPDGFITLSIGVLINSATCQVVVNGKIVVSEVIASPPATFVPAYTFLFFGTPASGTATGYLGNLIQVVRFADDHNPGTAAFIAGTIGTAAHSLPGGTDPGPTFLEVITRAATREGWYWRYTPQAYVVGTRTLGSIDMATDPGTDRGTNQSVVFSRAAGNLVDLQLSANADQFVTGTTVAGPPGTDGGGLAYWHDIGSMTKYGAIDDQVLAVAAPNFVEQQKAAISVNNNRINLSASGSKTAIVLRDPRTADVARELDKVMLHDPEIGINYLVARVIGYTFDEGQATQTLTLDQFSADDPTVPIKRLQQGAFQMAAKFNTRP